MTTNTCINLMRYDCLSLFPAKTRYLIDHTNVGKNKLFSQLSETAQRKLRCNNMHLVGNMKFTEENGFPVLRPFNLASFDYELYAYSDRARHTSTPWAVHFFIDDYRYIKAITDNLEKTTQALYQCSVVFAPDCSLYVDAPFFVNKLNIYRSRFAAAYWQDCGYNVIQTASWADANSLKYAFEGLAQQSATAICGIGHDFCKAAKRLWNSAVDKLVEVTSPTLLFIYGGQAEDARRDFGVPVIYIEDFINKRFRRK